MGHKKKLFITCLLFWIIILLLSAGVGQVQSQPKYPTRAIDMIVTVAAGGSTDLAGRVMGAYMNKKWGVPVNVINKPGGNSIPGCLEVYNAAPDGYTLLVDGMAQSFMLVVAVKNLPFKVMDRTFIGYISDAPLIIVVPSASPFKTLKDLGDEAKRDPESFTWSSQGGVGGPDLVGRQFFKAMGVDVKRTKPVIIKGGAEAAVLAAGGHVKMGVVTSASGRPAIQGGLVRVLGVADKKRDPLYPDFPTAAEVGYPGIDAVVWNGVSGPANLPSYIVDIWEKALQEMVKDPEVISKMKNVGLTPTFLNGATTREYVRKNIDEVEQLWGLK